MRLLLRPGSRTERPSILHAGADLFNLFASKFPLFAKKTGREYACCSLARKGAPCRKRKSSSTRDRMGRRRESGIAVAREQPPGERTTSLPQVSRLDPGSLMRVFGGLHRRAQQSLLDMLLPGEEPRIVVPGAAGSGIVATDARALVLKAGARFGAPFGARSKAFEYESVIGIRFDTETSPAVVAIDAPHKIASCRVYWADSRDDPWKARNAIPIEAASVRDGAGTGRRAASARGRLPRESSEPAAASGAGASRTTRSCRCRC